MNNARPHDPIEPLFAHNARLWLRVWVITQTAALTVASYVAVDRLGHSKAFWLAPHAIAIVAALLIAYHAVGYVAYDWIIRRTWAVLVYVPICWVLILWAVGTNAPFGLLALGAILQGFIFLPFAWAAVILVVATMALVVAVAVSGINDTPSLLLTRMGGVLATGIMIGTVLLYIHRSNRETALRTQLLKQLDDAQRDLADRARDAGVLEERQRLSRDIHDTLAQAFASVIRHLEAVELAFGATPSNGPEGAESLRRVMPHLRHAQAVSRASLADIRLLVWALRPAELTDAPLPAALGRVARQWGDVNGIRVEFSADPLPPLQPDADVIFLRATQEALSNVARHASATRCTVNLTTVDGLALLTVDDDGRGFEQAEAHDAEKFGLSGMRERVRRFGGHVLIESTIGAGTSLTVAVPLSATSARPPASAEGVS